MSSLNSERPRKDVTFLKFSYANSLPVAQISRDENKEEFLAESTEITTCRNLIIRKPQNLEDEDYGLINRDNGNKLEEQITKLQIKDYRLFREDSIYALENSSVTDTNSETRKGEVRAADKTVQTRLSNTPINHVTSPKLTGILRSGDSRTRNVDSKLTFETDTEDVLTESFGESLDYEDSFHRYSSRQSESSNTSAKASESQNSLSDSECFTSSLSSLTDVTDESIRTTSTLTSSASSDFYPKSGYPETWNVLKPNYPPIGYPPSGLPEIVYPPTTFPDSGVYPSNPVMQKTSQTPAQSMDDTSTVSGFSSATLYPEFRSGSRDSAAFTDTSPYPQ